MRDWKLHWIRKNVILSKRIKKASFWIRRRSHLPVIIIGSIVVLLLFFNEETSVRLNMEYEKEISHLRQEIQENLDSAAYYRQRREALEYGTEDLEHLAREQYHMQRPGEDVFLLTPAK